MSLTPLYKHLVRRSFTQLISHDEEVIRLFRQRVGEENLSLLSAMLVEKQPYRLMELLAHVISLLDDPVALRAKLKAMRTQQVWDNISEESLWQIGDSLLWVIEQELGDAFTTETQTAWLEFYRHLADLSI